MARPRARASTALTLTGMWQQWLQPARQAACGAKALACRRRFHGDIEQPQHAAAGRRRHLGALPRGRLGGAGQACVHSVGKLRGRRDAHAVA